jgi:hypothetical protein
LQFTTATGTFLHDHNLVGLDAGASACSGGPSGHVAPPPFELPVLPPVSSTWTVMVGYGQRWVESIGLESALYGTHSMRRTKAAQIYRKTGNLHPESKMEAAVRRWRQP